MIVPITESEEMVTTSEKVEGRTDWIAPAMTVLVVVMVPKTDKLLKSIFPLNARLAKFAAPAMMELVVVMVPITESDEIWTEWLNVDGRDEKTPPR